jgi:hypothetical protein
VRYLRTGPLCTTLPDPPFNAPPFRVTLRQQVGVVDQGEAARIDELSSLLSKESAELDKLERSVDSLRKRAKDAERRMEDAGGPALRRQRELCDKLQKVRGDIRGQMRERDSGRC